MNKRGLRRCAILVLHFVFQNNVVSIDVRVFPLESERERAAVGMAYHAHVVARGKRCKGNAFILVHHGE